MQKKRLGISRRLFVYFMNLPASASAIFNRASNLGMGGQGERAAIAGVQREAPTAERHLIELMIARRQSEHTARRALRLKAQTGVTKAGLEIYRQSLTRCCKSLGFEPQR